MSTESAYVKGPDRPTDGMIKPCRCAVTTTNRRSKRSDRHWRRPRSPAIDSTDPRLATLNETAPTAGITAILAQARSGDRKAAEHLFAALYHELKQLARRKLAGGGAPLHATSLVHEAWLKLASGAELAIKDREHFHATAARVMRQVIVDHIRARDAQRRGGGMRIDPLDSHALAVVAAEEDERLLALDAGLARLAELDPPLATLVELRFFGGLELPEISGLIGRSERSLKRDWRRARAFLQREIGGAGSAADVGAEK